jgi:hypothetical protein
MKSYKNPWSLRIEILYSKNSRDVRDKIEKKLSKLGEWIGHGSGFGAHDVQIAFKTEKAAKKAKDVAVDVVSKNNVSGKYFIYDDNKSRGKK